MKDLNQFMTFESGYWGLIARDNEPDETFVFAFDTVDVRNATKTGLPIHYKALAHKHENMPIAGKGYSTYFFVERGYVSVPVFGGSKVLQSHEVAAINQMPEQIFVGQNTRVLMIVRKNHTAQEMITKVEQEGRLPYIDGCKDTVVMCPPVIGDPVLNTLYMPSNIHQTMHTHPSIRVGMIFKGHGVCDTPHGVFDLKAGTIFVMLKDVEHKFRTDSFAGEHLNVEQEKLFLKLFAYHPDSDWGPEPEDHAMLNRTIVEGVSAKDIKEIQTQM